MKRKHLLLIGLASLGLVGGLVACGGGGGGASDSSVIKSLTIDGKDSIDTHAWGGGTITLKATITARDSVKHRVTWESSDTNVATVTNGVVRFKTVAKGDEKEVTITAIAKDDEKKKDSITFNVTYCTVDLAVSNAAEMDMSMFGIDGSIITQPGNTQLFFADVYDTKWYVEAEITIDDLGSDDFPKFGIIAQTDNLSLWNWGENETDRVSDVFYYIDAVKTSKTTGWQYLGFVGQNEVKNDWNWQKTSEVRVPAANRAKVGEPFKMGMLRDGADYYLYAEKTINGTPTMVPYKRVHSDCIAADTPSYAYIGGWNVAATVKGFNALVGDECDTVTRTPGVDVKFDGVQDDEAWTSDIKAAKYRLERSQGDYGFYIDFTAFKGTDGVYMYADYYTKELKTSSESGWWLFDNFEVRIGKTTQTDTSGQLWASAIGTNNFTDGEVATFEDADGYHHFGFEVFSSYEQLKLAATDTIVVKFGANPNLGPGVDAWTTCSWYNSANVADFAQIGATGLVLA